MTYIEEDQTRIDQLETEIAHYTKAVIVADSLQQLCDYLNRLDERVAELNTLTGLDGSIEDYIDITDLSTFGGDEPSDTMGIYSWDPNKFLCADSHWYTTARY